NARKVYDGRQSGLYSASILAPKATQEESFKRQMRDRSEGTAVLAAYDRIAEAVSSQIKIYKPYRLLEGGHAFMSDSFSYARSLLRAGDERPKPNGERLKEFGDARKASFEQALFSEKPVYEDLEIVMMADGLTLLA